MILRSSAASAAELDIDIWVMSCRVFGRQLEDEAMNIAVERARAKGSHALSARFVPSGRNGVIGDLFRNLGFESIGGNESAGEQRWRLPVSKYEPRQTFIRRGSGRS
jgi:predicted enzyme involved in methoxymalonyl-ACP biosynthesis